MFKYPGCTPYTHLPSPPSFSQGFWLLGTVCMLGDLPGSMNEEKEHLELSSTVWQGEGSLLSYLHYSLGCAETAQAPQPKPIQIHTAPGLRLLCKHHLREWWTLEPEAAKAAPCAFTSPPLHSRDEQGIFVGRQPERLCFFDFCQGSSFCAELERRGRTK